MNKAAEREPETSTWAPASREALLSGEEYFVTGAVDWAVEHLSERQAVFSHADLLAAALSQEPGSVTLREAEWAIEVLERDGKLHGAIGPEHGRHWATEAAVAREWETVERMREGKDAGERLMRSWVATTKLHRGRLNEGQKEAVKLLLSSTDRVLGVQGYAGTGKTTMLDRFRSLAESAGYRVKGLAPSASAARTLSRESGIRSETLQRYLIRHAGIVEGRATPRSLRELRAAQASTVLVVDESSLASSEQMRHRCRSMARIANLDVSWEEARLEKFHEGDDQAALGDHPAEEPFHKVGLHRRDGGGGFVSQGIHSGLDPDDVRPGLLSQGIHSGLDPGNVRLGFLSQDINSGLNPGEVRLGREVGIKEGDMLFGEGLSLFLGEAALGQAFDEAMSVKGNGLGHVSIIATRPTWGKNTEH